MLDDPMHSNQFPRVRLVSMPVYSPAPPSTAATVVVMAAAFIVLLSVFGLATWLYFGRPLPGTPAALPAGTPVAALNQEAEALQQKVVDLVTDSVESKLQTIETNLKQGHITVDDLRTLQDLHQELKILSSYVHSAGNNDAWALRGGLATTQSRSGDDLFKGLIYLGLAAAGVIGLVASGYWLANHLRQRRLNRPRPLTRRPLGPWPRHPHDDLG